MGSRPSLAKLKDNLGCVALSQNKETSFTLSVVVVFSLNDVDISCVLLRSGLTRIFS